MTSRHDHPTGYVILDADTNKLISDKVYRSMGGVQRSKAWKEDPTKVWSVCKEFYEMYYSD